MAQNNDFYVKKRMWTGPNNAPTLGSLAKRAVLEATESERHRGAGAAHRAGAEGGAGRGGRRGAGWRPPRGSSTSSRSPSPAGCYRRARRTAWAAGPEPQAHGPQAQVARTARTPPADIRPTPPLPHNHVTNQATTAAPEPSRVYGTHLRDSRLMNPGPRIAKLAYMI